VVVTLFFGNEHFLCTLVPVLPDILGHGGSDAGGNWLACSSYNKIHVWYYDRIGIWSFITESYLAIFL